MVTPPPAGASWEDPVATAAAAAAAAVDPVWPEMWRDQPALVFPARPDRPVDAVGWLPVRAALEADATPAWLATLDDTRLSVTGREGDCWYAGLVCTARAWRRAVRARGRLLLVTGPFTHPLELPAAARAGRLLCAVADVRISGPF
ncbi:hypothetical protein [Streptacidiphilus jiangxiensis]|uniref:Uncharacterized protein n=1 Tax=Streptacidiphilus jiangxiensis TaxID=235985 RepID=A0A1H7MSQ8_STRJI|nr:hypothetical protein [Streptacidiphilus jiangxiensis]SEL14089.1 hypothetical protein SAMN05414137_10638 [Streptacidiphilus jiangxiensis]